MVRSPNFNPIEGIFVKIKHDFKKNQPFDKKLVIRTIIESIKKITPDDVRK